jgi:hypothetical protein
MAESVVKYRPAICSASNFPEAIIRLKAAPVIDPSGKASCAATSRRNGVVVVTVSGAGRFFTVGHFRPRRNERPPCLLGHAACLSLPPARFSTRAARIFFASPESGGHYQR